MSDCFPVTFAAGDTVTFSSSFADHKASDGWSVIWYLNGSGRLHVTAVPAGDDFITTISATQTTNLVDGLYEVVARASLNGVVETVYTTRTTIKPDPATQQPGSRIHHVERAYKAVTAVIEGRITNDVESFSIAGRSVTHIPIADLMKLRAQYARELYRLKNGSTQLGRDISVTFGNA